MDQEKLSSAADKISRNLMQLMRTSHNTFVVNVLLNLTREPSENIENGMTLEGTTLKYDPAFILDKSDKEVQFALMHVTWHIPFFDMLRAQAKDDKEIWNQAADNYNNLMIKNESSNGVDVPDWAECQKRFNGKEKDEIYDILLKEKEEQEQQDPNGGGGGQSNDPLAGDLGGQGQPDNDGDGDGEGQQPQMSQQQMEELQQQMESIVQQAAMQTKMAGGDVPNNVENWLEELYNPKLPWDRILAKYMDDYSTDDYSYQKVNKKFFPHGILLPTTFSEGLGEIVIANDESGSVSDDEYKTYLGAIHDIHDRLNPAGMHILNFTTKIVSEHKIERDDDINKINFRGCGGTHIPCVFDHIEKTGMKPQVLILFSDMESPMPTKAPNYDTIWISVNNPRFKQPFGRCIHIEV
ncbi:hypothetical protein pVco7_gp090 [Vibrio phage pVco-7]